MRTSSSLLLLSLLVPCPDRGAIAAQSTPAPSSTAEAGTVVVRWNELLPTFASEAAASRRAARAKATAAGDSVALGRIAQSQLPMTFNTYTLVSVAQYQAANAAQPKGRAAVSAAVASASAAVLTNLYKDSTVRASIARELAHDLDRLTRSGDQARIGKSIGGEVARQLMASAPTLNLVTPWKGTIPTGAGMWYSARGVPPIGISLATSRSWLLDSASQFRPAHPPAFGSPIFEAAMEEVRRVARERTPEHTGIAQRWNSGDPWVLWNERASTLLRGRRLSEVEAARVMALLNVATSDAAIACFEAKYHYWTIRPSQVDSTLSLADSVTLPNFPSYPSGHACSAGAFEAVLGNFFPDQQEAFTRVAEEQAMSRLYAGVHYRFDNDVGLDLGRAVARHAIAREKAGALRQRSTAPRAR